jgi:peptidyl-prolyl cis-trans isomerase B (cyclophilin B)
VARVRLLHSVAAATGVTWHTLEDIMPRRSITAFLLLGTLVACPSRDKEQPKAAEAPLPAASRDTVVFETGKGRIVIELNREKAPQTVANFERHVTAGFYDGLVFHRIAPGFVIQAGRVTEALGERKSAVMGVENEARNGLSNLRGTVGMARTADPHSGTSEFFINLADNAAKLDFRAPTLEGWGYAVFGRVIEGLDVVDAIAATKPVRRGQYGEYPTDPTVIRRAYMQGAAPAGQ